MFFRYSKNVRKLGILGRMKSKEIVNSRYDKFRNIDRGEIK